MDSLGAGDTFVAASLCAAASVLFVTAARHVQEATEALGNGADPQQALSPLPRSLCRHLKVSAYETKDAPVQLQGRKCHAPSLRSDRQT